MPFDAQLVLDFQPVRQKRRTSQNHRSHAVSGVDLVDRPSARPVLNRYTAYSMNGSERGTMEAVGPDPQ